MALFIVSVLLINKFRQCNNGRHPLYGDEFTTSVFSEKPIIHVDPITSKVTDGVIIDLLNIIADKYKFSYNVILSDSWFQFYPNGTIGGSLGEVTFFKLLIFTKHHCVTITF